MANLALTATNIRPLDGSVSRHFNLGGTVALGDLVYVAADGDIERADGNVSAAAASAVGILVALNQGKTTGAAGDRGTVTIAGPVAGFTGLTPGARGYVSDDAGKIEDAEGTYARIVGFAESETVFYVMIEQNDPAS